jgi:hypothetical protein
MQANAAIQPNQQAAYESLQNVIVRLSSRRENPRRPERNREFSLLVTQALDAYREYIRVMEQGKK